MIETDLDECDECGRETSLKTYHGDQLCIVCWDAAKRGVL